VGYFLEAQEHLKERVVTFLLFIGYPGFPVVPRKGPYELFWADSAVPVLIHHHLLSVHFLVHSVLTDAVEL
jgi:hypothetical protein